MMKTLFSILRFMKISCLDRQRHLGLSLLLMLFALGLHAETIVLENADFENWVDSIPVAWYGGTSNIDSSAVSPSEDAYSGKFACCLVKTQKTHARFSSQPFPLKEGYYQLTYYAKGKGDIRNSYFKGKSYDAYSEYVSLSEKEWTKIDYIFHVKADLDSVELIFSVASTSKEGVLIDALSLQTTEKPTALLSASVDNMQIASRDEQVFVDVKQSCTLQVFDVLGRLVLQESLPEGRSSFELERGVYLLRSLSQTPSEDVLSVQKISIQ